MIMRQQRILFNPSRTVMYTIRLCHRHRYSSSRINNICCKLKNQFISSTQILWLLNSGTFKQQPRLILIPHPRPIVSTTQQPSQNVIFHQVPTGQNFAIQQPQGVISSQLRSTIRAKNPRGDQAPRGNGPRAATPIGTSLTDPVKTPKARGNASATRHGNRGGRTVRRRTVFVLNYEESIQMTRQQKTAASAALQAPPQVLNTMQRPRNYCSNCKRVFIEDSKRMPCQKTAAAAAAVASAVAAAASAATAAQEDKKRTAPSEILNRSQTKALTALSVTPSHGGRTVTSRRRHTLSGRSKPAESEPVISRHIRFLLLILLLLPENLLLLNQMYLQLMDLEFMPEKIAGALLCRAPER